MVERIKLAESGISPWNHEVELVDGKLILYWTSGNGSQRIRTFSHEETCHLAEFLYDHKEDIFFPNEEEEGQHNG